MLPIRTILHPTDFSERSDYAFRVACSLARDYGARLLILHVAPQPVTVVDEMIVPQPEGYQDQLREKLAQFQSRAPTVRVEHRLVEDRDPTTGILRVAEETKADLIIMGTHGRTGLGRLLMGSVAELILRKAPCPVLTVKTPLPEVRSSGVPSPVPACNVVEGTKQ